MKCANCEKELTSKMEIEYSAYLTEYFCSSDCATDRYFNYLSSTPIDFDNLPDSLKIVDGKLEAAEHTLAVDFAKLCENCGIPVNSPNFAYHICVSRKATKA